MKAMGWKAMRMKITMMSMTKVMTMWRWGMERVPSIQGKKFDIWSVEGGGKKNSFDDGTYV
jgi:hypothetical protein